MNSLRTRGQKLIEVGKAKMAGVSIGMILLLVIASIFLAVGAYLVGQFQVSLNTSGLPANSVSALESVYSNAYNGLILMSIGLIVIAAVAILQVLTSGFGKSSQNV